MQTVKLSVTVKRQLEREYNAAALKQINTAIKSCIVAGGQSRHLACPRRSG